jgi:hypothetical protein
MIRALTSPGLGQGCDMIGAGNDCALQLRHALLREFEGFGIVGPLLLADQQQRRRRVLADLHLTANVGRRERSPRAPQPSSRP